MKTADNVKFYYLFRLLEGSTTEQAYAELEKKRLNDIYVIEDDSSGEICLGGHCSKKIKGKLDHSVLSEMKENDAVDWAKQWELFAEDFREGKAHIDLTSFGSAKTLLLKPGAGFGDLSHPTTYLMLEMMRGQVEGKRVVDVGTGSGILSLAALILGAEESLGIDIEEKALKHAEENAEINDLSDRARFMKTLPKDLGEENVFLMNMILPEQREFKPDKWNSKAKLWIVSGILEEQEKEYLDQAKIWNWIPISAYKRSGWLGWVFKTASRVA